jgi:hypothetical protein
MIGDSGERQLVARIHVQVVKGLWECCLEGSEGVAGLDGAVLAVS